MAEESQRDAPTPSPSGNVRAAGGGTAVLERTQSATDTGEDRDVTLDEMLGGDSTADSGIRIVPQRAPSPTPPTTVDGTAAPDRPGEPGER
jgi:hypothetical protein